jgi:carbamoyltransferase
MERKGFHVPKPEFFLVQFIREGFKRMKILGISAFYHDSAAVLLINDKISAAAQEERFTRKKHDSAFPDKAIRFCLDHAGVALHELDAVVFYEKPFLKFERLLETYYAFAPRGLRSFMLALPVWIKEKLMLKRLIYDELLKIEKIKKDKIKLLFPEHHLSHAASAFFPSPFQEAAIITVDGVGEWATASISHGRDNTVTTLRELRFPHSVGLLYSAFTYYLGFKVNSGEYKLMGLAPYGNEYSDRFNQYIKLIKDNLVDISRDGSVWLNQEYFDYSYGLRMVNERKWEEIFGIPRRNPDGELSQEHCDLALAAQRITEEIIANIAEEAKRLTGAKYLCLAGGVALNCVASGKILRSGLFEDIWIQPAAGDAGGALGAAYCAYYIYFNNQRVTDGETDKMEGAYLGPEFSRIEIERTLRKYNAASEYYANTNELCEKIAELCAEGNVIGWFQGRMEWGPRALGNRSILGDARSAEMQKRLNLKIKFRESFRPFAPSVLFEETETYFEIDKASPYMLFTADVKRDRRRPLPDGYHSLPWRDKLYFTRSDIPSVTHLDHSARIQTVHHETNPRFRQLLKSFQEKTGYGLLVNTSFNVRGEPIVCTPEDAYECFMKTEIDYLVIEDFLLDKKDQPGWKERHRKEAHVLD